MKKLNRMNKMNKMNRIKRVDAVLSTSGLAGVRIGIVPSIISTSLIAFLILMF